MRMEGRSGLEHVKKIRTNASVNHRHSAMVGPDLFLIKIDLSPLTGNNVHEPMSALCAVFTSFKTELNCCSETAQGKAETWRELGDNIPQLQSGRQLNCQGFRHHMRHFEKPVVFILSN